MADTSITVRMTQGERPVRHAGQEDVPSTMLRREPWYLGRTSLEVAAGESDPDLVLHMLAHYLKVVANSEIDVYVVKERRDFYGNLLDETPRYFAGTISGGDQGLFVKVGDNSPLENDGTPPLRGHFTPGRRPSKGQRHTRARR